jgi:predicted acetyltransferase
MEFRLSRDEEYAAVRQLWGQAFGEEEPWTSWYFSQHYQADKTWVGVENGKVLAQAHLLPHRLMLRGKWRTVVYFVGVCVEESLRGTGIGRQLMASALVELRRTGVEISILQPRWPDFYRKLGWNYGYSRRKYSMPVNEARRLLPDPMPVMGWSVVEYDIETLSALYRSFTVHRHAYAMRERQDWEKLLADHRGENGRVGVVSCGGIPLGYGLYKVLEDMLWVRELVCPDVRAVDAALKFMINQTEKDGVETLEWDDPAGDSGSVLYAVSQSEPFLMGRVTDIRTVLAELPYPDDLLAEIDLTVADTLSPWNNGSFRWSIRQGKGVLTAKTFVGHSGLSLDIGTLSQLIFGEQPVWEILKRGNAGIDREEGKILERIFPLCRNFISEYF